MVARTDFKGRKAIDPEGDTKALTVRLPAAVKAELDAAAAQNGRSVSQEMTARLVESVAGPASPLGTLVAAFEERLTLFCGTDWREPDAAAALSAGLNDLLTRLLNTAGSSKDAGRTGMMVADLTYQWVKNRDEPECKALRSAFLRGEP